MFDWFVQVFFVSLILSGQQQANKNYLGMEQRILQEIAELVETVTMNIGYPVSVGDLRILHDHHFYFDICLIIFPELNIKIIKIGEDSGLSPAQQLQKLLQLLTEKLQINLAALSGAQILNGHSMHLRKLLNVLKDCSYLPPNASNVDSQYQTLKNRTNSCPYLKNTSTSFREPKSARQPPQQRSLSSQSRTSRTSDLVEPIQPIQPIKHIQPIQSLPKADKQNENVKNPQPAQQHKKRITEETEKKKKKNPQNKKQQRSVKQVVKKTQGTKKDPNKKYSSLLQNLMKKQEPKKQSTLKPVIKQPSGPTKPDIRKQLKQISDFFKSFELKIRDQKQRYLRKMQQLIRKQENQRIRINLQVQADRTKLIQEKNQKVLAGVGEGHRIRTGLLRERAITNASTMQVLKKEQEAELRRGRTELKLKKQNQLNTIKQSINELNNQVLMKLEEGGPLETMIINLYRKY